MTDIDPRTALNEAIAQQNWPSARTLLRRLFDARPTVVNAQLVLAHSRQAGLVVPGEAFKVAFVRAYTVEPLLPIIKAFAAVGGINLEIEIGNFNTYVQEVLDENSWLYTSRPQVIFFALQCRDLLPEVWNNAAEIPPDQLPLFADRALKDVRGWIEKIRARSDASVVLPTLDTPLYASSGILDSQNPSGQRGTIERFNRGLRELAAKTPGVYVLDMEALVARLGKSHCYDAQKWRTARLPFTAEVMPEIAREYAKYIHVLCGKISKVLVVDLDNTLWGGVIGEDGLDGIKIGPERAGVPFHNLQRALLDLYHRGITLAICSKNNYDDGIAPFEKHAGMLLRSSHFAAMRINWEDKAQNLRAIAQELNLGLDSMTFLDDNPVERDRVSQELPEVQVLDLPDDPALYADVIRQSFLFERLTLSEEDRVRSRYYAEERERRALQNNATSVEDFYRSLEMEAEMEAADAPSVGRIAQLTQKTNQFNLTTRRYTEQQIQAMTQRADCSVYFVKSRDRFGDNGIVGVAIAQIHDGVCEVDTFLLSCRVIGRMLERAMLSHIAQEAKSRGIRYLQGWFIPTAKNKPAADLYPSHGFQKIEQGAEGSALWRLDLTEVLPEWPPWIKRTAATVQRT